MFIPTGSMSSFTLRKYGRMVYGPSELRVTNGYAVPYLGVGREDVLQFPDRSICTVRACFNPADMFRTATMLTWLKDVMDSENMI